MTVPFYKHDLGKEELDKLSEVFSGEILTTGVYATEVEAKLSELLGCRHALAVSSCTGALHLSLVALGIGPGDEVITTPMTFAATALAIMEAGAIPIFVDVESDTGNIDADLVEAAITSRTKAIMPVHLYGLMCDMKRLSEIATKHDLFIIEDAAHCLEGIRDGVRPGQLGTTACFSFYATKNLTCGEGGALVTNDDALAERLRLLRLHGMTKTAADRAREGYKHWDIVLPGWKYNLSNIEAAILLPQFARVQSKLERRHALAEFYTRHLSNLRGLRLPSSPVNAVHARHLFPVWIGAGRRDTILDILQKNGIGAVVNYRAVHLLTLFSERYGHKPGSFPIAERIGDETISLPYYPGMPDEQAERVVETIKAAL